MSLLVKNFLKHLLRQYNGAKKSLLSHPKTKIGLFIFFGLSLIYVTSKMSQTKKVIFRDHQSPVFKEGRILGSQASSYLKNKEMQLGKTAKKIIAENKALEVRLRELEKRMEAKVAPQPQTSSISEDQNSRIYSNSPPEKKEAQVSGRVLEKLSKRVPEKNKPVRIHVGDSQLSLADPPVHRGYLFRAKPKSHSHRGPRIISFPVKHKRVEEGITLPTGSYVKAKLMTGVDAPEGKTYPVLLALDYSHIGPNKRKVDLSGCFMIAKSSPSIATERINFQATRLSCVSQKGKFFERKVSGFIADNSDNTFAVRAKLNSKQGRVAQMAFLKSVVDGIGEIISRKSQNIGGKNPDSANVLVQNSAHGAATKVSDWYLKQVTSLMPTLAVHSGQDVWIVMQEKVLLPNDFFIKNEGRNSNGKVFSYLTRIID